MSREEFDALPAAELQRIVDDPVLVQFILKIDVTNPMNW